MNHAVRVAIALALGAGLAATAQAHGTNMQGATTTPQQQSAMTQQIQPQATNARPTRQHVRQARLLKRNRLAMARFQQQRLHRTAALHRKAAPANQAVGVGSSTMPGTNTTQITPPATGAGSSNTTTTNQNYK